MVYEQEMFISAVFKGKSLIPLGNLKTSTTKQNGSYAKCFRWCQKKEYWSHFVCGFNTHWLTKGFCWLGTCRKDKRILVESETCQQ